MTTLEAIEKALDKLEQMQVMVADVRILQHFMVI